MKKPEEKPSVAAEPKMPDKEIRLQPPVEETAQGKIEETQQEFVQGDGRLQQQREHQAQQQEQMPRARSVAWSFSVLS